MLSAIPILTDEQIFEEFIDAKDWNILIKEPENEWYLHDENGFSEKGVGEVVSLMQQKFPGIKIEGKDYTEKYIILTQPQHHRFAYSILAAEAITESDEYFE